MYIKILFTIFVHDEIGLEQALCYNKKPSMGLEGKNIFWNNTIGSVLIERSVWTSMSINHRETVELSKKKFLTIEKSQFNICKLKAAKRSSARNKIQTNNPTKQTCIPTENALIYQLNYAVRQYEH